MLIKCHHILVDMVILQSSLVGCPLEGGGHPLSPGAVCSRERIGMCVSTMPASPASLTLLPTPQDSPVAAPAAWGSRASRRGSHSATPHGLAKRASPPGPDHLPRRCAQRGRRPGSGLKQREHGTARGVTRAHGGTAGHGSESEAPYTRQLQAAWHVDLVGWVGWT